MAQVRQVGFQHLVIQIVLMISAFLFRFNQSGFNQNFDVVRNGGLSEINHILDFRTLSGPALVGNKMEDLQAVGIAQRLRNLFHLFNRQFQNNRLKNANVSIILDSAKNLVLAASKILQNESKIRI